MGQNKAILGYFLASVHKRRNYNSCNTSDLLFGSYLLLNLIVATKLFKNS